jgi:hypothetical protein
LEQDVVGGVVEGVQAGGGSHLALRAWAAGVGAFLAVAAGAVEFLLGVGEGFVASRVGLGRGVGFTGDLAPALDVAG